MAKLREDAGEEWEDVEERWTKAKDRIRDIDLSGEDDDSSPLGTIVALAAGVAATYFLTSDRAAPVRSRVQGAASDMRRRASDQWDRFQRGGFRQGREGTAEEARPESRAGMPPARRYASGKLTKKRPFGAVLISRRFTSQRRRRGPNAAEFFPRQIEQ